MSMLRSVAARAARSADRGQAIAELAVIAPLMAVLLVGLIDLGRFAHFSILVSNAARAGVQYGSQNLVTALDYTGMENAATGDAQNTAGISATATSYCKCADGSASTCQATDCSSSHRLVYVQVTTTGTFQPLVRLNGLLPSLTIPGKAVMRVTQ